MSATLGIILAVLKLVGLFVDRLDAAEKAKAQKALLDAARMEVEDDVADRARAAYSARLTGVQQPYEHYRD